MLYGIRYTDADRYPAGNSKDYHSIKEAIDENINQIFNILSNGGEFQVIEIKIIQFADIQRDLMPYINGEKGAIEWGPEGFGYAHRN